MGAFTVDGLGFKGLHDLHGDLEDHLFFAIGKVVVEAGFAHANRFGNLVHGNAEEASSVQQDIRLLECKCAGVLAFGSFRTGHIAYQTVG